MNEEIWAMMMVAVVAVSTIWAIAWVVTTYFKYGYPTENDEREEE